MLTSYKRRAFLVLALAALPAATSTAAHASESDSLWDLLARASAETVGVNTPTPAPFNAARAPRQPLGPVPGFSLPAPADAAGNDAIFNKKPQRSSPLGSIGDWFNRLEKATGSKIRATGNSNFTFRADNISGGADAFHNEQDYGRGSNGFYNNTDLTVDATLFKYLHYQTRISNSLFNNPNDNRVKLDYKDKHMRFEWGDINAGFQGNSLLDFNRYLSGMQITNNWNSHLKTTVLWSQTKAETRTIVIPGSDTSGPYFVYAGQIVEGSEHVRVDNSQELEKGKDYQLDPFNGQLQFLNNRIIPHSSTIAISYETLGFNQSKGNIYGGRAEYKLTPALNFGMTYVAQTSRGSNGLELRSEELHGFGTPTFYTTDGPIDLTKPLFVFIGGRQLAPDEYTVDNSTAFTNRIFIKQSVPFDTIVKIQYIPYNSNPTPGNRSIIGLDSRLSLGKLGSLTLETALSGLSLTGNNISGHAWQFRADLNPLPKVHTTLSLRNINPTFSSIQSPGFNRNEKALEFASEYSPNSRLHLNFNFLNSQRPSYSGGNQFTISSNGTDNYGQYGFGVNYAFAKNASLSLTRNSLSTTFALGGKSTNDSDTLSFNYALKSLTFDASLSNNKSNVLTSYSLLGLTPTSGSAEQTFATNTSTFSKRFGIGWQPARWLHLTGSISNNDITNNGTGTDTHGKATDTSFNAQFSLIRNLRLNYTYSLSDSGNNAALLAAAAGGTATTATGTTATTPTTTTTATGGTTTALGNTNVRSIFTPLWIAHLQGRDIVAGGTTSTTGSSTSGFGSSSAFGSLYGGGVNSNLGGLGNYSGYLGNTSNYGLTSYGGKNYQHSLHLDYQPKTNMLIGIQLDKGSSVGDYQFNSSRDNFGFNFSWQANSRMQMNASYAVQKTAYTGTLGGSNTNSILFGMQGKPFGGKLGVQINWSVLSTKSAFNFSSLSSTTSTTVTTSAGTADLPTNSVSLTDTSTNLSSLGLRFDYPISSRQTLFVETLNSNTSGFLANVENDLRFGLDYSLTRTLKFSLGWQILQHTYKDQQNANLNYKASSLLAEFGFHF